MQEERNKGGYIGQAWLVILLALLYGGGLAGVQTALSGKIQENKKAETYEVIPDLVSGADASLTEEVTIRGENGKDSRAYKVASSDGSHIGWVLPAGGSGFADRIELLIGLDTEVSTITGLYVLDQKETPGLGDNITTDGFRQRFRNAPTDRPLVAVKTDPSQDNEIRALSGATISSESVAAIVNDALANCRAPLQELAAQARPGRQGPVEPTQ
ncbi:MAG: FMN-binding protein [Armatimonadota bacterium]|nr:FMN-binding protein [Armatimonadota bacterium]